MRNEIPQKEADFQRAVIDLAKLHGWMVAHFRPARTEKGWRTLIQGDPGFPDLVLARAGDVILAELKTDRGKPNLDQEAWLIASKGLVWAPRDWPEIERRLK